MIRRARRAAWIAASLSLGACGGNVRPCKDATVFLTVDYDAASASADAIALTVTVDGHAMNATRPHAAGAAQDTIEIDFAAGYPAGKSIAVAVAAQKKGAPVGTGSANATLASGCSSLRVAVTAGEVTDGGGGSDLGDGAIEVPDLTEQPDMAGCVAVGSVCNQTADNCCAGGVCSGGLCAPCGGASQACCASASCGPTLVCDNNGQCVACGGAGQPCCPNSDCSAGNLVCVNGVCASCGDPGAVCCPINLCNMGGCCVNNTCILNNVCPMLGGDCNNGRCGACGGPGDACCTGGACTAPFVVCDGTACVPCGMPGMLCCANMTCMKGFKCDVNNMCNP
jgi:hypothetical protein